MNINVENPRKFITQNAIQNHELIPDVLETKKKQIVIKVTRYECDLKEQQSIKFATYSSIQKNS